MKERQLRYLHLLLVIALINFLAAQMAHEMGHGAVLQLFGRGPVWGFTGLVQLWDRMPMHPDEWVEYASPNGRRGWLHLTSLPSTTGEWVIFLAAGPLAQLAVAVAGFLIAIYAKRTSIREIGLFLALTNSLSQVMYQIISTLLGTGGDESLIAFYTGLSRDTISLLFGLTFAAGLLLGIRELVGWRTRIKWASALILGTLPVGPLLKSANEVVIAQVDEGNPLFHPILGFSLPVLIVSCLAFLILLIILVRRRKSLSVLS